MMALQSHKPMHWVEMSTDTTQRQGREQLLARFSHSHLSYPLSPKLLHTLKLISLLTTGTGSCDTYQDALQTPADILPCPLPLNVCPDADSLPQCTHKMLHPKLCNSVKKSIFQKCFPDFQKQWAFCLFTPKVFIECILIPVGEKGNSAQSTLEMCISVFFGKPSKF